MAWPVEEDPKKKTIQFNLRFAYSLIGRFFLLFTNFEKQRFAAFCFLLGRNSCQSQLIFILIYIHTSELLRCENSSGLNPKNDSNA